jgi:3-hydroxyacyl-[acyl-carrier-protein] dehydratase
VVFGVLTACYSRGARLLGRRGADPRGSCRAEVSRRSRLFGAAMRYVLVDKILELESRRRIVAVKNLSAAEEYLADHFPGFPIMPGVLMLEALCQAGAWLVRVSEDFRHSIILLRAARAVRYASFVEPGRQLLLEADWVSSNDRHVEVRATGRIGDEAVVTARLTLTRFNLADRDPRLAKVDQRLVDWFRQLYPTLTRGLNTTPPQPTC